METYYKPEHLAQFAAIAEGNTDLAEKFFAWYGAVFAEGALTAREKALIALAVAHAVQCPYCIDAYTQECLEEGRRSRADDRSGPRRGRDPRRGVARPRRPDARARAATPDGVVTPSERAPPISTGHRRGPQGNAEPPGARIAARVDRGAAPAPRFAAAARRRFRRAPRRGGAPSSGRRRSRSSRSTSASSAT